MEQLFNIVMSFWGSKLFNYIKKKIESISQSMFIIQKTVFCIIFACVSIHYFLAVLIMSVYHRGKS